MTENKYDRILKNLKAGKVERFGVSIERELLRKFDSYVSKKRFRNRSDAIRNLIRKALLNEEWSSTENMVISTISILYNHHTRLLQSKLTDIQHSFRTQIISTIHIHIDKDDCLEIMIVRGKGKKIREMTEIMSALKGVKYARASVAAEAKG